MYSGLYVTLLHHGGQPRMDLTQHQIDLEALSDLAAQARALALTEQAAQRGSAMDAGPGVLSRIKAAVPAARVAITGELLDPPVALIGDRKEAYAILLGLDPDVLAVATLNVLYSAAVAMKGLTGATISLGATIAVEHYAALALQADKAAVKRLLTSKRPIRGRATAASKLARIIRDNGGPDPLSWSKDLHIRLGEPLVSAVVDGLDLFELVADTSGEAAMVILTETALAELEAASSVPWVRPRLLPMVVEPQPWDDPDRAPYLTEAARSWVSAVRRTRGPARARVKASWDTPALQPFRRSLDALGQAAFVVDQDTLAAVQWTLDQGLDIGGVPSSVAIEHEAPPRERPEGVTPEQHRLAWEAHLEAEALNYSNRVSTLGLQHDLGNLRLLANYGAIYQPHYADFRGRLYPASAISHHREDAVRAAFRFAVPAPLGATGRQWLARHVANTAAGPAYGKLDKAPWSEREAWTEQNTELLTVVAQDWRDRPELWTTTDSPFSFLAAAREWAALRGEPSPTTSMSGLVIGLDGTCSGLQHYAAALRSETEGALVNLTPGERPSDIYAAVAERVTAILAALANGSADGTTEKHSAVARLWLDYGVTRSTVKRQTMTFAYSSEVYGFRKQLWDDLVRPLHQEYIAGKLPRNPLEYEGADGRGDQGFAASLLMAKAIWRALGGVVEGAAVGMDWIKEVASLLARHEKPLTWDSPSGFPVYHAYKDTGTRRVHTFLGRRKVALRVLEDKPQLLPHKQRSAAAPNVIHSLDAAHLHLTTAAMAAQGVTQLAMIHDSFGTAPGHVEALAHTLRREFVGMYEGYDVFEELHRRALDALPEEARPALPQPPKRGSLDIRRVLESDYIFC